MRSRDPQKLAMPMIGHCSGPYGGDVFFRWPLSVVPWQMVRVEARQGYDTPRLVAWAVGRDESLRGHSPRLGGTGSGQLSQCLSAWGGTQGGLARRRALFPPGPATETAHPAQDDAPWKRHPDLT